MKTYTIKYNNASAIADPYGKDIKWDTDNASHMVEIMNRNARHLGLNVNRCTNPRFIKSEEEYGLPTFNFEYEQTPQELLIEEISNIMNNHSDKVDIFGKKFIALDVVKSELEYLRYKMNETTYEKE